MTSSESSTLKIALTAAAAVFVGSFAFSHAFFSAAMVDPFFALELGSLFILLLRLSPKWSSAAMALTLALAIGLLDFGVRHFGWVLMACFSFLGLASFFTLLVRLIWEEQRRLLALACGTAFVFSASEFVASSFLQMTSSAHPKSLDLYVLMFDASLRIQPAYVMGRLYTNSGVAHTLGLLAYIGLAVPITMVYAGRLVRDGKKAVAALVAFVITGPLGLLLYNIFPVSGPHNLFGNQFPFAPIPYDLLQRIILEPLKIGGPRNGMPSLHLAWTLLAWWYSRGLSRGERIIAFAFLALTAFATMGTGEHWLADLVVAFPFALMVQAICAYRLPLKDVRRQTAFIVGLTVTLVWFLLLRYGTRLFWTSPIVPWSLIASTLALTTIRQNILASAEETAEDAGAVERHEQPTAQPATQRAPNVTVHDSAAAEALSR
jgi:hypothetical protein